MFVAPTVYGPPKPSAVAQIRRLNSAPSTYVVLRANPSSNATASRVSAKRVSHTNSMACGVTASIHRSNHHPDHEGCPWAALRR